jgi:His-Xaa-Ser system radical SAM maturase HxsC
MIPLTLGVVSEAPRPFVARIRYSSTDDPRTEDAQLIAREKGETAFAGVQGLFTITSGDVHLDGDIIIVDPERGAIDRILRAGSQHNTLLVTERCDQLCVMCSQPPKKTHDDRFAQFKQACALAEPDTLIGISGGEPTLYKAELFDLIESTLSNRPDLSFHVLSNGQHFETRDVERLRDPIYRRVLWGIPLYSCDPATHDQIVGKLGAFEQLEQSLAHLLLAGARIELRTVVMEQIAFQLHALAQHIATRLSFIEAWSIMQLENIGFAKNRWESLYWDHSIDFGPVERALLHADLHGIRAQLFNFPRCTVPENYRHLAPPSISDWKRKYAAACMDCAEKDDCSGFFEWHPKSGLMEKVRPL